MKINDKELIEEMNHSEFFFRDYGTVQIDGFSLIRGGEVVEKITSKNIDEVRDAINMTEYGTTDMNEIMRMEGF